VPFGLYADGKFTYTHYMINATLSGSTNERDYYDRFQHTLNCLTKPSEAMIFAFCPGLFKSGRRFAKLLEFNEITV
ncbi:MAG TPA: hypothetical protein PLU80_18405, partial [Acidobacteriota bacterium]|nr:hypothetical protein [Acidobacteriota bacterium]